MYNKELFEAELRVTKREQVLESHNIESLFFDPSPTEFKLNLEPFKNLRHLRTNVKSRFRENLSTLTKLEQLSLYGIDINKEDISKLLNLKYVTLTKGNISTLEVFKELDKVLSIDLFYLPKLNSIKHISNCKKLIELEIESCKKIQDIETTIVKLKNLRVIKLVGFELTDIEWVKHLPNLEHLAIIDTNILSGDISPAKDINYVAIDNKRHYNYRFNNKTRKIEPLK